jgi:hypothetical protein
VRVKRKLHRAQAVRADSISADRDPDESVDYKIVGRKMMGC